MHFKNTGARLITIATDNGKKSTEVIIAPGETKEVKGELGNAQDYVDYLVNSGQLTQAAGIDTPDDEDDSQDGGPTKEELQEQLDALNVEYDKRSGVKKLQELLDEALAK